MVDFDASTPQLRLIKKLLNGYCSLDMSNVEPLLSKDYQYEPFPECAEFPKQTKESHLKLWGEVFSSKTEVRIQRRGTDFRLRLISTLNLQMIVHEVIEAPGKVVLHVRPSIWNCHVVSDRNT